MSSSAENGDSIAYDELLEGESHQHAQESKEDEYRTVNLILDPSAFTRGIGNIRRWYHQEYIESKKSEIKGKKVIVNLFIPSFTLHEFEYLKKGSSITGLYTRQAIRFIDQLFENNETSKQITPELRINLSIEGPHERGPGWSKCTTYQIYEPKVKDFPNFKTKFDSNSVGRNVEDQGELPQDIKDGLSNQYQKTVNDIQYENSASYMNAVANAENFAVMPTRLRYLISSCIFKRFKQQENLKDESMAWILVSEEPITQIWARSFGIKSMNVNEAELLIFQSYDVNRLYNPNHTFSLDDDIRYNTVLHETIDTTQYEYIELETSTNRHKNKKKKGKQPKRGVEGVASDKISEINGDVIHQEKFDSINYAPRNKKGQLWLPNNKKK